ncbi:MAG: helix-turn-helix domain-containing protein [Chitinophagaceae bacterium]
MRLFKSTGKRSQREYDRANILLLLHKGKKDSEIVDFLEVERTTVWRTRKRYLQEGLEKSLQEKERSGQPRKYNHKHEAELIALACSDPPEGRARWSLELLKGKLSKQKGLESINRETIRLILKKTNVSLG